MKTTGKVLYHETCGQCEIFISEFGNSWIVGAEIEGKYHERMFNPSPYEDKQPYDLAIKCYDDTLNFASKRYNVEKPVFQIKPDFKNTLNI